MTATADEDIAGAFEAALAQDAGVPATPAEPSMPAPPPKAPAEEKPKPKRAVKPKGDDKPRTAPVQDTVPLPAGKYAEGLMAFGEQVWFVASLNEGLKLGKRNTAAGVKPWVSVPDTRPYAAVFRQQLPVLAKTWGEAAKQNPVVRKYVSKVAGDGDGSWVLGVAFSSAMFCMGCANLARAENEQLRAQLAGQNDKAMQAYMQQLAEQLGLDTEEQAA
jgi:hypothetical protein